MLKKIRQIFALVIMLTGLVFLTWGILPGHSLKMSQLIQPGAIQLPSGGAVALEARQVRLEWPSSLRIGDEATVTVVFEPASSATLPASPGSQELDIYQHYNLMVESRLEAAGLHVVPANPRRESLPAGQAVRFTWQITAQEAGTYPAKAWLLLRFLPLQGGQAIEAPVFVHEVNLRAKSLMGLNAPHARLWGSVGIVIGLALSYDVIIGWIRRMTTKSTKDTKG